MSHTSPAPIVCQPTAYLVTPPYLPLVASVDRGTQTPEVQDASGVDGMLLGTFSIDVDGARPRSGDDIEDLLQDWVMHGTDISAPESASPSDATLATGSSCTAGPGVSRLVLPSSPGSLPLPIDKRQVEDNVAFTCSQVTDAVRLLHETLASVGRNILRQIWVSLIKEREVCLCASVFL
jgi:hypothetical protein